MRHFILMIFLLATAGRCFAGTAVADSAREWDRRGDYASALALIDNWSLENTPPPTRADSITWLNLSVIKCHSLTSLGMATRAAEGLDEALTLARKLGCREVEADIMNSLFKIHYGSKNYTGALDLLHDALDIYRSTGNVPAQRNIINNIGLFYYNLGDIDGALEYFHKAIAMVPEDSDAVDKVKINIAEMHYKRGELEKSEEVLRDVVDHIPDGITPESYRLQAMLDLAQVKARRGHPSQARRLLPRIYATLAVSDPAVLPDTHRQLAEIYFAMGDSLAGVRHVLRATAVSDSIEGSFEKRQLRQLLTFYSHERLVQHNTSLELEVKNRNLLLYIGVAAVVILLAFSVFLINRIRADRRKNSLIRQQKEKLIELEREAHEMREREYRLELDRKNRQLTSFAIDGAAISELHKKVCDTLGKARASASDTGVRPALDESISALRNFTRAEVTEDFRVYFNEVHPEFYTRLLEKFPNLTDTDLRLCSYLYLGMSTKEIAALTFREIRSVESSRLRLRKKLGIPAEQSINAFLRALYG